MAAPDETVAGPPAGMAVKNIGGHPFGNQAVEPQMKISDVPQDRGMIADDRREICYAVDADGNYVLAESAGWEPKNVANSQAWDIIRDQVQETLKKIEAGQLSPLAFHMVNNQMNVSLLAKYARLSRWRVRRHLKPAVFNRLKPHIRQRYADIFEIEAASLSQIPVRR